MNPIRLSLLAERTSYRTDPPGTGEPEWSWEDCAHALAAGGASDIQAAAFEFRWRGAGKCRHALWAEMMVEAVKAERLHRWSERIDGRRYIEPMVELALHVEMNPRLDGLVPLVIPVGEGYRRLPGWWCLTMPWMSEPTWRKTAEPRYAVIRQPLDIWVGEAIRKARPYLRDHDV